MPPRKQHGPRDIGEAFLSMAEELKVHAHSPNLYAYSPHFKQVGFHSFGYLQPDRTWRPCRVTDIATGFADEYKELLKEELVKIRLYIGGNRSGKTVGGIVEDLWWVTKTHPFIDIAAIWPEPVRGRICSTDFKNGVEKIIIPQILQWCPRSYMRGGSWVTAYDNETDTLYFNDGGFIEFMSYDQALAKFAGTSRHFVHFDEEPPEDIYIECMARLVDTGGCCWFTMTPVEGMTWIFDRIYEPGVTEGKADIEGAILTILVIEVDMFDNPFVSDEEKQIFVSFLDQDDIKARVHGQFVRRGGLVYKDFDEKIHVVEPTVPSFDYLHVASMDSGFRNPTVWLWHAVNFEGRIITYREHYASGLVIAEHAKIVHEINKEIGRPPDYNVGDPSIRNSNPVSGTSVLEEYMQHGIPIILGNNDVHAGIVRVAGYLKSKPDEHGNAVPYWLITENCPKTIWEIKRYRWASWAHKRTEQEHNVKEEPVKKDDHAMDALRYFIMSQPDIRAEMPTSADRNEQFASLVGATSKPVSWESEATAQDWEANPNVTVWNKDYAMNAETSWQTDEYMGGEW